MEKTNHYFSENPKGEFLRDSFTINLQGQDVKINSGSGVFSIKELDFGSKLLIENAQIPKFDDLKNVEKKIEVLDLGCGYGIIGICLKKKNPDIKLTMVDINERAVKLTRENCKANNVECEIHKSDIFSHLTICDKKFDVIVTNPPFSAGRKVCIDFIEQSFNHIKKDGLFQLVAPHNKGGDYLKNVMIKLFGNADELAKKSGYRVYISIKK